MTELIWGIPRLVSVPVNVQVAIFRAESSIATPFISISYKKEFFDRLFQLKQIKLKQFFVPIRSESTKVRDAPSAPTALVYLSQSFKQQSR